MTARPYQPVQVQLGAAAGAVAVAFSAGLRPHDHEVGANAGPAYVWRHHSARVGQPPLYRQRALLTPATLAAGGWQSTGAAERCAHPLVVVRRHLQGQVCDHEQLVEQVVDTVVLLSRRLDEHASRILCGAVSGRLFRLYSPAQFFLVYT